MKTKFAILLLVGAVSLFLAATATGTRGARQTACGPKVSLLFWPKGYKAYPLPNFEVFRGLRGPYGISNLLAYGAATKDGTLGYPATNIGTDCLNYGDAHKLRPASLSKPVTSAIRLACTFSKQPFVTIDSLPRLAKRVRVVLAPDTVVADATITTHGSSLKYATKYCIKKLPLIEPSS